MDKILEKMEAAAEAEYEKILAKWGVFHSAHEGYSVLLEEVEEAQEEMESLREDMKMRRTKRQGSQKKSITTP